MPDTLYSGDLAGLPAHSQSCADEVPSPSKYFDGHVTVPVDSEPHIHAQKLHALLAGLDAVHESDEEFGKKEKSEIICWLLYMATNESAAMMQSFANGFARRAAER